MSVLNLEYAPQSGDDVSRVVEALRRLDHLLDVRWEPRAKRVGTPHFDAVGKVVGEYRYDGRWQVIRWETPNLHDNRQTADGRQYALILTVCELAADGTMAADGPYAPLGDWLVAYMARWDRAQARFQEEMDKEWARHEAAESTVSATENDAFREAASRIYTEHGDGYWIGGAAGRADPRTVAALWGNPATRAVGATRINRIAHTSNGVVIP